MRSLVKHAGSFIAGGVLLLGLAAVATTSEVCGGGELTNYPELGVSIEVCPLPDETTTTTEATTTTPPPTTTEPPTTTPPTVPAQTMINLTADLHIHADEVRSNQVINANGHEIVVDGADLTWTDVEVHDAARIMWHGDCGVARLTRVDVFDSGVAGQLGFYPIHFHLCGDTTRGSVLQEVRVFDSANRAFVPHGSHGITLTDIEAHRIAGAALWWDRPGTNNCSSQFPKFCTADNSNDIIVDGALFTDIRGTSNRNTAVQLGAGSGNEIRNTHVGQVQGGIDCAAYAWPESANQNVGGNVWVFENNTSAIQADPDCHGIFVWQNDSNHHIIENFTGDGIDHGAYLNDYDYRNVDIPYLEVHAVGWVMSDSIIGDVILRKHQNSGDVVLSNVTITGEIRVSDAPSGSQIQPVDLIITGDASCSQVVVQNGHPDTTVTINGQEC